MGQCVPFTTRLSIRHRVLYSTEFGALPACWRVVPIPGRPQGHPRVAVPQPARRDWIVWRRDPAEELADALVRRRRRLGPQAPHLCRWAAVTCEVAGMMGPVRVVAPMQQPQRRTHASLRAQKSTYAFLRGQKSTYAFLAARQARQGLLRLTSQPPRTTGQPATVRMELSIGQHICATGC